MQGKKICGLIVLTAGIILSGSTVSAVTIAESIQKVLNSNPQVKAQAYNRLGRDGEVQRAQAGYYPTLDFVAGTGVENFQEPDNGSLNPTEFGLSLRQNVFAGFATENEVDRQEARVRSAAYNLQGISENIALKAAEVYLDVLRMEELKIVAEKNLQTHKRISDQVTLRSESGVGTQVDTDQVLGRLALAESNVVVTNTNLIDAKVSYVAVIGAMPANLTKPTVAESLLPVSLTEAENSALASHPTLKSAMADLDARNEQYEVAKSPFYPTVDIEVDQVWEDEVNGIENRQDNTIAMLRLRYSIFNGFSDNARKYETKQLIEEAREIKSNTERQVIESINLSWMAYQSSMRQLKYLEQHVTFSIATAKSYAQQFNLGQRSLLDVLNTEAEMISSQQQVVEATYDGLYAQYRILNGMGGLVHSLGLEWPKEAIVDTENQEQADN